MKKFVLGLIVGAGMMLAMSAYADDIQQLVGKSVDVEYPVVLNGQQLDNKAPAIEGTSYAPVREISERLGLKVEFENNTVVLTSAQNKNVEVDAGMTIDIESELEKINNQLEGQKSQLVGLESSLSLAKDSKPDVVPAIELKIKEIKDKIIELEHEKSALEKQRTGN